MATRPRAVDDYLRELERALRDVPSDRRNEIVSGIEEHIAALLAELGHAPSTAETLNVLERVGRPEEIARELRDDVEAPAARRRWTDVAAVVALPIPFLGWIVGGVLVWLSDVWSTRDKVIGTLAGPGMLVLGGLGMVSTSSEPSGGPVVVEPSSAGAELTGDAGGGSGLGPLEVVVTLGLFVVPLLASIYLARKLRAPHEPDGRSRGGGGPRLGDLAALALLVLPVLAIVLGAGPSPGVIAVAWGAGVTLLWLSTTRASSPAPAGQRRKG